MAFIRRRTAKEIQATRPTLKVVPPLQGAQLPSYSGEEGACGKCGATGARTAYHNESRTCIHLNGVPSVRWGKERMHRSCRTCGYVWDEQVPSPEESCGD